MSVYNYYKNLLQIIVSSTMSIRVFLALMFLQGFVIITSAEFGECDYEEVIEVGKTYYIFNPGYPYKNYEPGSNCRWIARSDRPINMTCNIFELPASERCSSDAVIIQISSRPGRRYCGTGSFSVVSKGNEIITELHSSSALRGGKFLCYLKTVTSTSDDECRCGWKNPTRIVGGEATGVNEYPMMAGLIDSINRNVFCGATIINPTQVITAAHCVYKKNITKIGVLVGDHDTSRGDETNSTKLFRTNKITVHERYSPKAYDYDIAIVNIDGTIEFNELVGPACLPVQHSQDSFGGSYVDILGWGSTDTGERQADILQKVRVHIITNKKCSEDYPITTRQMCTYEDHKDSCQFDSGGPVLWMNPSTKRIVIVSLVSYGSICASKLPAVNSRVGAFIDWILLHTPSDYQYCEVE